MFDSHQDGSTALKATTPAAPRSSSWGIIARFYKDSLSRYLLIVIVAVVCVMFSSSLASLYTYMMGPFVDKVLLAHDKSQLWVIGAVIVAIFFTRSAARYLQEGLLVSVGQKIVLRTQRRLFQSLLVQDVTFFNRQTTGGLVGRFTYDVNLLRVTVCDVFQNSVRDITTVVSMIGVMFAEDWKMAIASLIFIPISYLPLLWFSRRVRAITLEIQSDIGRMTSAVMRVCGTWTLIRTSGLDALERRAFKGLADRLAARQINAAQYEAGIMPVFDLICGLTMAAVTIYGGKEVLDGALKPGVLLAFTGAVYGAYQPLRSLARVNVSLQTGLAAADRIYSVLDRAPDIDVPKNVQPMARSAGSLVFENVVFRYGEDQTVLHGISFVAEAGKMTAIVGPSGAGKTTILSLIARFYQPNSGTISIGGRDLSQIAGDDLYDNVTLISEDCELLDDTLGNNIRFGRFTADDIEIAEAISLAGLFEFVQQLPLGLETVIGEQGVALSGGQRQQVLLARALLRNAPILLLDEVARRQDVITAARIEAGFGRYLQGRTVLMVSHDVHAVQHADKIYVVVDGQVAESGTHGELFAGGGVYSQLFSASTAA